MKKTSLLKYGLHAAIIIGVVVAAIKYLNGEEIILALTSFRLIIAPIVLALSTAYILLKSWRFIYLMRPVSDLKGKTLMLAYLAGTAATLLPGGIAARAGLTKQAGAKIEKSSAPVAFSSILDQASFIAGTLIAAFWYEAARIPSFIIAGVLGISSVMFWVPTTRNLLAKAASWVAAQFKQEKMWESFLDSLQKVFTLRIITISFALTLVGLLLQVIILDLCLRGFDVQISYPTLFLAYILPTMLGRLSGLPAGVGVTETTMVGFLESTGRVSIETAVAAAAIFRIVTIFFQALLGAAVYFFLWKGEGELESES